VKDEYVESLIDGQKNMRTKSKTVGHVKILNQFLQRRGDEREVHTIQPHELNEILANFFMSVRRLNGENYEPSSLRDMLGSFERHLREKGYQTSIITDIAFDKCRRSLQSKQKELKKQGKGNKPNKAATLTDQEKEKLYVSRQLGDHIPQAIINTLWLNNTIHFGLRGVDEHRKLQWGDIVLHEENGDAYIEFNERDTKTRTGNWYLVDIASV